MWVVDNLHLIVGVEEWQFLTRVPKGVSIIATCDSSYVDLIATVTPQVTSRSITLPRIDAGYTWSLQQHYCQAYQYEPDDQLVWKMVEKNTVHTVSHARTILMAHRLVTREDAPWKGAQAKAFDDLLECPDAETAFVRLVRHMQTWQPELAQVIIMTAWSHRGLREMELLALIDTLNQTHLRRYKEMVLDEVLMPVFGVYDFVNITLKLALRKSMLSKESRKEWHLAPPALQKMIDFFGNPQNGSDLRRSVECPTIFSSDSTNSKLFDYLTSCQSASLLATSQQIHMTPKYIHEINLTISQYVGLILDDLQQQFGVRVDHRAEEHTTESGSSLHSSETIKKIFNMFAVHKNAADALHHSNKVGFATKNDGSLTMSCDDWMHAVEYLELMDSDEEHCVSESEAMDIFVHASGADEAAEISFTEFRYALMNLGKRIGIQLNEMLQTCLEIAQLHRLFNFYAAGARPAAM